MNIALVLVIGLAVAVAAFGVAALVLLIQLLVSRPDRVTEH